MMRTILALATLVAAAPVLAQGPSGSDPFQAVPAPAVRPRPTEPPPRPRPPAPPPPQSSSSAPGYPVKIGESFRDCAECPEMVVIPPGSFTMGSPAGEADRDADEGPPRRVTLRDALAVGKYHVTVGEYRAFAQATGRADGGSCWIWDGAKLVDQPGSHWRSPGFAQTERDPVVCVSWEDAAAYAAWVSQHSGQRYRLLTEAEWEYAARAGTTSRWWWGDDVGRQCGAANGLDQRARQQVPGVGSWPIAPCDDGYAYTSPVGRFAANRFGLYDMGGNAWQRVQDCYWDSYAGAPMDASTPVEAPPCEMRVLRGGSWLDYPGDLRSADRGWLAPEFRYFNAGFRVARTPGP